ncbi:class I hydrophobin superfamily [Pleurotus ostreatus PC15]|uniref:Class I hydrophobin 19 n=1 Tax=Pleurotus ostreatus (strain PC15) TaxID=1137138 RepID=HYD19_PLEO1|nr:class I hydrophobin superfamily [Pleurotus ostreatus PC15]
MILLAFSGELFKRINTSPIVHVERRTNPTTTVTVTTKPSPTPISPNQCNTNKIQCCNSVQSSDAPLLTGLLGLLGIVLQGVIPIGVTCSPISVIGIGGNSCSAQTVCCENNTFNGVIAIGCTPINIDL